jgi:hypothetical protein
MRIVPQQGFSVSLVTLAGKVNFLGRLTGIPAGQGFRRQFAFGHGLPPFVYMMMKRGRNVNPRPLKSLIREVVPKTKVWEQPPCLFYVLLQNLHHLF